MATLRALRETTGLTVEELAAKVGVSPAQGGTWERGASLPTTREIRLLALALGVQPPQMQAALAETRAEG